MTTKTQQRLEELRAEMIGSRYHCRTVREGRWLVLTVTAVDLEGSIMILLTGTDDQGTEWTSLMSRSAHQVTRMP